MEIIFLLSGIFIGVVSSYFYLRYTDVKNEESKAIEFEKKLFAEREKYIKAEVELSSLKKNQEQMEQKLKESIENLTNKKVHENNKLFLSMAEQSLEKYFVQAEADLHSGREKISMLLSPLNKSLEKQNDLVKELENHNRSTYGSLKTHIEELVRKQESLEKETGALVSALKTPKVRGKWGEIGLKRIVEFSGMSEFCHFSEQTHKQTDDGALRPDMIVYLPENRQVIVDSKVPLSAYLEALECEDEGKRKQLFENHTKALGKHVQDLSSKAYWSQFDDSVDFVILYIEIEAAFGAALSYNKDLLNKALENRILFAVPTTLIALLQTIAYSWKQHKATENAMEIWRQAKLLYERLAIFSDNFSKAGNSLQTAVKQYNAAVGSWQSRVIPGIKKLDELGAASEKKKITEGSEIENNVKEITP